MRVSVNSGSMFLTVLMDRNLGPCIIDRKFAQVASLPIVCCKGKCLR